MKKIAVGLIAVFGLVFLQPVHAEEKSLVIIDQYFDVSKISGSVTVICVALDKCKNMPKSSGIANSKDGHGTAMAEIARINNPTAPLILIRSSVIPPDMTNDPLSKETLTSFLVNPANARDSKYVSSSNFKMS